MKKILIVEFWSKYKKTLLLWIKKLGYDLYVASTTYPERLQEIVDPEKFILTDTYNSTLLVADVSIYMNHNSIQFDGIWTFWEATVTQTADLAAALWLKTISPQAARRSSQNKLLMRTFCEKSGIKIPRFKALNLDDKNFYKLVTDFGFPSVIKPLYGSSSQGVVMLRDSDDVQKAVSKIKQSTTRETEEVFKNFSGQMLLEEYVPWKLISVDGVIFNGEITFAWSVEFFMGKEPYFTQVWSLIPARIDPETFESCKKYATSVIDALGFNNCWFHCELRVGENKEPILIEIAARLPGGPLVRGYMEALGVNLLQALLAIWTNEKPHLNNTKNTYSLHKCIFPNIAQPMKLSVIQWMEKIKAHPHVWDLIQEKDIGDILKTYPEIPDSVIYYALSHENLEEILTLSEKIETNIIFSYEKP